MDIRRFTAFSAACVMLASCTAGCAGKSDDSAENMRDITTMELVRDMGIGINLGNTFESCGDWIDSSSVSNFERGWGSPLITEEMIKGYADCGFGVLRVPVAWSNMMDMDTYQIDQSYIDRVKEVVGWAIDDGMYVIMNIHWDGGWWDGFPTQKEQCMERYRAIWTQLCENFGSFSDKLMFESLNEEGGWSELWDRYSGSEEGKAESYALLGEINQEFVNIVRSSGGNNEKRHLLIAGYNTDVDLTCDDMFVLPDDPALRYAVSVHYYTPSNFCILDKDASWGKAKSTWGSPRDYTELNGYMDKLKERFIDHGIPVIVGEYGAVATANKTDETIRTYNTAVTEAMYSRGICPVLWDTTGTFYDRTECRFIDQQMLEDIMAVKQGDKDE